MGEVYLSHLAILVSAISNLVFGAIWYSKAMFYEAWRTESELSEEQINRTNFLKIYGLVFLVAWMMSYNLTFF
ncbi:MAG: DUF1761 domain-containing protein [Bacteroidetes Order II. Incertae sedis bacterium]|nr:DUF1761 domain-containing protein [Bacteroidetes Order II. bacterium]